MNGQPEPACLVIADISGYTSYLAGVELDHAQDILADLMSTVVGSLKPRFKLAKLEGDAAFAYAITDTLEGSGLQDTVEATYAAFRRRLRDIGAASRCECNACIRIPDLDLKVVVHHGPVIRQRIAGYEELVGADVILIHRLLKNDIVEALGVPAYAAYTAACLAAAGIDEPAGQGFVEHHAATDVAGEVTLWVKDLAAAWADLEARTRVIVEGRSVARAWPFETPASPQVAWEYVTSPARRIQWNADDVVEQSTSGRRGLGTINHCIHGRDAIIEEIVDYRPYAYETIRAQLPVPGSPRVMYSHVLEPLPDGGTRVEFRLARPKPRDREAFARIEPLVGATVEHSQAAIVPLLAAEGAARGTGPAEPDASPAAGRGRHLTEPVRS